MSDNYKNISNKIAIILAIFSTIIVVTILFLNLFKEKDSFLNENKKRARILSTQIKFTLSSEAKLDTSKNKPHILVENIENLPVAKGVYSYNFLRASKTGQKDLSTFEQEAFLRFEEGENEVFQMKSTHYQYISPIYTEEQCIRCHVNQKTGNLMAGLSIIFPIKNFEIWMKSNFTTIALIAFITFLIFYIIAKIFIKIFAEKQIKGSSGIPSFTTQNENADKILQLNKKITSQTQEIEILKKKNNETDQINQLLTKKTKDLEDQNEKNLKIKNELDEANKRLSSIKKDGLSDSLKKEVDALKNQLDSSNRKVLNSEYEIYYYKKLAQIISLNIGEGTFVLDNNSKVVIWGLPSESITGYSHEKMLGNILNENIFSYESNDGRHVDINDYPVNGSLKNGKVVELTDITIKKSSGEKVSVNIRTLPLKDNQNKILGVIGIISKKPEEKVITQIVTQQSKAAEPPISDNKLNLTLQSIQDHIDIMRDGDTGDLNNTQMDFIDEIYFALKEIRK